MLPNLHIVKLIILYITLHIIQITYMYKYIIYIYYVISNILNFIGYYTEYLIVNWICDAKYNGSGNISAIILKNLHKKKY